MAEDAEQDRISLEHDDGETHHTPVILPADELQGGYADTEPSDEQQQDMARRERQKQAGTVKRRRAERRARKKVVQHLKENGHTDEFIAQHQDLIDEKVKAVLQDRE